MRPNFPMVLARQRGSILLMAIFAMVVLGGLGVALSKINTSQQHITAREILGARAWFAANSGSEWAMTQLFPLATNPAALPQTSCSATPVITVFTSKGLIGCSVSVRCEPQGVAPLLQYRIESTGRCGSGEFAVARVQEVWGKAI